MDSERSQPGKFAFFLGLDLLDNQTEQFCVVKGTA